MTHIGAIKLPRKTYWGLLLKFSALPIILWLAEFTYQYWWLVSGDPLAIQYSLVRSFALAGATLIGFALASSVIFRWMPRTARHWRIRRYLGVSGFIFAFAHALSVYYFYFAFDLRQIYFTLNPLEQPIIFGTIALPIFMIMAFTSTDWVMEKLTPRVWKFIHRFVYVAYLSMVFHFILINPETLKNPAGYLLIAITAFVLLGHTQLFLKTAIKKRFRSLGSIVGIAIILCALVIVYLVFQQ